MIYSVRRICYQLLAPVVLIFLSCVIVWKWPEIQRYLNSTRELKAFFVFFPVLPYAALSIGMLMGFRYNSLGLMLASVILALSYFISINFSPGSRTHTVYEAYAFLIPLNIAFCSMLIKRHIFTSTGLLIGFLFIIQMVGAGVICGGIDLSSSFLVSKTDQLFPQFIQKLVYFSSECRSFLRRGGLPVLTRMSAPAAVSFIVVMTFMMARYLRTRDIFLAGYFGSLVAVFITVYAGFTDSASVVFHVAAGLILIVTTVEASLLMAYNDELTGLPGRRSLNESMLNLGKKYTIAMMDIDHFKRFNDRYGHKTGDDVLKMVAAILKEITGSARVFRYGGEEFAAVFSGKSVDESIPHLEKFRKAVEKSQFVIRKRSRKGKTAKNRSRGPAAAKKRVRVTISIGASEPGKKAPTPEKVIKAADKALYKAKKAGRNRVVS